MTGIFVGLAGWKSRFAPISRESRVARPRHLTATSAPATRAMRAPMRSRNPLTAAICAREDAGVADHARKVTIVTVRRRPIGANIGRALTAPRSPLPFLQLIRYSRRADRAPENSGTLSHTEMAAAVHQPYECPPPPPHSRHGPNRASPVPALTRRASHH